MVGAAIDVSGGTSSSEAPLKILRDVELDRHEVIAEGKHVAGDVIIGAHPRSWAIASAEPINYCRSSCRA
jgi:hypothetical protein